MSNLLAIFGATGHQGDSVINYILNDPELSRKFKIRAITRTANSEKAKQLKEEVQVVEADVFNRASLETALTGADIIFSMTVPDIGPDGFQVEYNSGKMIADVAVEKGAEYIIFSTLPSAKEVSGGKYAKIIHFDAKAQVERLPMAPGSLPALPPTAQTPCIDVVGDTGKFVSAILAKPDKFKGKTFCAATALYSWEEIAATLSTATGKPIVYRQISVEGFEKSIPFDAVVDGISYIEEFGYWSPDSKELIASASKNARDKLSTLEDYLEAHPPQLAKRTP